MRAEGLSAALSVIGEIAKDADSNTLLLQYLGALKELANSPSTKILFPMELTNLLSGVRDMAMGQGSFGAKGKDHSIEKD